MIMISACVIVVAGFHNCLKAVTQQGIVFLGGCVCVYGCGWVYMCVSMCGWVNVCVYLGGDGGCTACLCVCGCTHICVGVCLWTKHVVRRLVL